MRNAMMEEDILLHGEKAELLVTDARQTVQSAKISTL